LQLTEAGIIGKIGLNSQGLGITLNFLFDEYIDCSTVPIHIVMRQILECQSLDAAYAAAEASSIGKASNLIIAQLNKAADVEFAGDRFRIQKINQDVYTHTNHFLHAKPPTLLNAESYQNSSTRQATVKKMVGNNNNITKDKMIEILSDQSNGKNAILANYKPDPLEILGDYGTLATIIMDLQEQSILVRLGNPGNKDFDIYNFEEFFCN
jgi:isopenicillin-N N-acyltransferase-like protein